MLNAAGRLLGAIHPLPRDPYRSSVSLLMHMDASGFPDVTGKTVTNTGVTLGTPAKFGGGAGQFAGAQYLDVAASTDFLFPGDVTMEGWFYSGAAGDKIILSNYTGNTSDCWMLLVDPAMKLTWYPAGGAVSIKASVGMSSNAWHHVAAVRQGTNIALYQDGVSVATGTQSGTLGSSSIALRVGATRLPSWYANGALDDIRITKGVARYTGAFTPYDSAFPDT